MRNIYVFLRFANFYLRFIQGFSRFAVLLIFMPTIALATGLVASAEVENEESDGKRIQVDKSKK